MSKQAVRLHSDGDGVQLQCTRGTNRGDVLLMVPDSLWLTVQTVAKSRIGPMVGQLAPWLQVRASRLPHPTTHAASCRLLLHRIPCFLHSPADTM